MPEDLTVSENDFAALMAGLGPFETAPGLAIAVSGGADSLALCLLAARWVRGQGGELTALTVNHGLRREATAEAAQVGRWLAEWRIPHQILTVTASPPQGDIQHWARRARYALLQDWCAANGVLHLLLAHHQGDQAETLLLRLARGSGVRGLSAMAAVSTTPHCRILRPLLSIPKVRLEATLRSCGQGWVSDPSNDSVDYARVRIRHLLPPLAEEGLTGLRLAETARILARSREGIETVSATLLAQTVSVFPAGVARITAPELWRAQPEEVALRALAGLLACLGGQMYPPRADRLERALSRWGQDLTVGGCRMLMERGALWIWREQRGLSPQRLWPGQECLWDRRFRVTWRPTSRETEEGGPLLLRFLGRDGVEALRRVIPAPQEGLALPRRCLPSLPSVWSDRMLVSVPHLGYSIGQEFQRGEISAGLDLQFTPTHPISPAGLTRRVERAIWGNPP